MITHFMEETLDADRLVVMNNGYIVMQGGKEIFERERELDAIGLDVPPIKRIANKLRAKGVDVQDGVLDAETLAGELCR